MDSVKSMVFLAEDGKVGINTTDPISQLEVAGTMACKTRIGVFKYGKVPANGEFQDILSDMDSPQAFEVVARVDGPEKSGKYAPNSRHSVNSLWKIAVSYPANQSILWFFLESNRAPLCRRSPKFQAANSD